MNFGLAALLDAMPDAEVFATLLTAGLYAARYFGFFSVFPLATWLNIGGMLRLVISVILAMPEIGAHLSASAAPAPDTWYAIVLIGKEALVGGTLGVLLGAPVWAAQGAGDIIDSFRGASLSNTMDPMNAVEVSSFGQLNGVLIQAWLVGSGLFRLDLELLSDSFTTLSVLDPADLLSTKLLDLARPLAEEIARSVLVLAGPMLIVLFLSEFVFGLIGRLARQFHFDSVSVSGKSLVFYLLLPVYASFLYAFADTTFRGTVSALMSSLGHQP